MSTIETATAGVFGACSAYAGHSIEETCAGALDRGLDIWAAARAFAAAKEDAGALPSFPVLARRVLGEEI